MATPMARPAPSRLRKYAALYLKLQLVQLRTVIAYRADFWIGIAGAAMMHGAGLIFMVALFGQVDDIAGWTAWEVAILYGLALIPRGLTELFCDGPWTLRVLLNRGEFDRVLVRPLSPALQVATQLASIHGLGQLILGTVAFCLGASRSGLEWTWWKPLFLMVILASSLVMLGGINYLVNLIGFWEPASTSALPTAYASLIDFAKFPLDVYGTVIRALVSVVAPYAFLSYFPALVLLDRDTSWRALGFASPLVAGIVALGTARLWRIGLDRYQGVGH